MTLKREILRFLDALWFTALAIPISAVIWGEIIGAIQ